MKTFRWVTILLTTFLSFHSHSFRIRIALGEDMQSRAWRFFLFSWRQHVPQLCAPRCGIGPVGSGKTVMMLKGSTIQPATLLCSLRGSGCSDAADTAEFVRAFSESLGLLRISSSFLLKYSDIYLFNFQFFTLYRPKKISKSSSWWRNWIIIRNTATPTFDHSRFQK